MKFNKCILRYAGTLFVMMTACLAHADDRPNIVIILADDMGFADLGSFGGEINTPNIDALADAGVRFTQFYTHASCSPTRSVMLSGVDTHLNGLGNMDEWTAPNQVGKPGYEGFLNDSVVTLAQLLKETGYHTYMTGKSWIPMLAGQAETVRSDEDYLAWEIFGNRALRQGEWKIRWQWKPFGTGDWELYNLSADPAERNNLAA